jgi:hypothetical protein
MPLECIAATVNLPIDKCGADALVRARPPGRALPFITKRRACALRRRWVEIHSISRGRAPECVPECRDERTHTGSIVVSFLALLWYLFAGANYLLRPSVMSPCAGNHRLPHRAGLPKHLPTHAFRHSQSFDWKTVTAVEPSKNFWGTKTSRPRWSTRTESRRSRSPESPFIACSNPSPASCDGFSGLSGPGSWAGPHH